MLTYGQALRQLLDEKYTTLRELEEITGRGTSTIYRWLRGESEPTTTDAQLLIRHINPKAQRHLATLLTADIPVVINWVDIESQMKIAFENEVPADGNDVVDMTLLALECVSGLLLAQREIVRKQEDLTPELYGELSQKIGQSIEYLTTARVRMDKYITHRKKARPVNGHSQLDGD